MTLDELQTRRSAYLAAEIAILQGQEYRIRDGVIDRSLRRADLESVQKMLVELDVQINLLLGAGTRRILYLR